MYGQSFFDCFPKRCRQLEDNKNDTPSNMTMDERLSNTTTVALAPTLEEVYRTKILFVTCIVLGTISVILCTSNTYFVFGYQKRRVAAVGQPPFLYLICFGALLGSLLIYMYGLDERNSNLSTYVLDTVCVTVIWLSYCSISLIDSSVVSKLWRVNNVTRFRCNQPIQAKHGLFPFVVIICTFIGVFIAYTVVDASTWLRGVFLSWSHDQYGEFDYDGGYYHTLTREPTMKSVGYGSITFRFDDPLMALTCVIMLLSLLLSCRTRKIAEDFSDSRRIFQIVISHLIIFATGFGLRFVGTNQENVNFLAGIDVGVVFCYVLVAIGFMIGPKMYYVWYETKFGNLPNSFHGKTLGSGDIHVSGMQAASSVLTVRPSFTQLFPPSMAFSTTTKTENNDHLTGMDHCKDDEHDDDESNGKDSQRSVMTSSMTGLSMHPSASQAKQDVEEDDEQEKKDDDDKAKDQSKTNPQRVKSKSTKILPTRVVLVISTVGAVLVFSVMTPMPLTAAALPVHATNSYLNSVTRRKKRNVNGQQRSSSSRRSSNLCSGENVYYDYESQSMMMLSSSSSSSSSLTQWRVLPKEEKDKWFCNKPKHHQQRRRLPKPTTTTTTVATFSPMENIVIHVTDIVVTTMSAYVSGFFTGIVCSTVVGLCGNIGKIMFQSLSIIRQRRQRPSSSSSLIMNMGWKQSFTTMNHRSWNWAKNYGSTSAIFSGLSITIRTLRKNNKFHHDPNNHRQDVDDVWDDILSSAIAGALLARKDGLEAMIRSAIIYAGLIYVLSGTASQKRKQLHGNTNMQLTCNY